MIWYGTRMDGYTTDGPKGLGSGARGVVELYILGSGGYKVYGPTDDGPKGLGSGARRGGGTDTW